MGCLVGNASFALYGMFYILSTWENFWYHFGSGRRGVEWIFVLTIFAAINAIAFARRENEAILSMFSLIKAGGEKTKNMRLDYPSLSDFMKKK
jgi:hypothetical protein